MDQKKSTFPKWLKITGIILLVLVIIGALSDKDKTEGANTSEPAAQQIAEPPITQITTNEIVNAYVSNEVAADNQYKGKTLVINGVIEDIGKDVMGSAYIVLKANTDEAFRGVQCTFKDQNVVASLSKGQQVSIKGECTGLMMNVQMDDCELY